MTKNNNLTTGTKVNNDGLKRIKEARKTSKMLKVKDIKRMTEKEFDTISSMVVSRTFLKNFKSTYEVTDFIYSFSVCQGSLPLSLFPDYYISKIIVSENDDRILVFMYDKMTMTEKLFHDNFKAISINGASDNINGTMVVFSKKVLDAHNVTGNDYVEKVTHTKLFNRLLNEQVRNDCETVYGKEKTNEIFNNKIKSA